MAFRRQAVRPGVSRVNYSILLERPRTISLIPSGDDRGNLRSESGIAETLGNCPAPGLRVRVAGAAERPTSCSLSVSAMKKKNLFSGCGGSKSRELRCELVKGLQSWSSRQRRVTQREMKHNVSSAFNIRGPTELDHEHVKCTVSRCGPSDS